ncbi:MAG: hypothetical protein GXP25_01975 [Planctomycetes bacterium]|nr:hypothetical protein [Planctomycetota bacterium]
MIFELVKDFSAALEAMPADHPKRRMLQLLEEAIRRDIHFIDRHPTTLFQCMWNLCWWYDCPDAVQHYEEPEDGWGDVPWAMSNSILCEEMQQWRGQKEETTPGFHWLRSLRPPGDPLHLAYSTLRVDIQTITKTALSPDGQMVVIGSDDGVYFWDVASSQEVRHVSDLGDVSGVSFSPGGRRIAVSATCATVIDAVSGTTILSLGGAASCVRFSPDGELVGAGCEDGTLRIWDADTGELLRCFECHAIVAIAFSPGVQQIASVSCDGMLRAWSLASGELLGRVDLVSQYRRIVWSDAWGDDVDYEASLHDVAFFREGGVACCTSEGTVELVDVQACETVRRVMVLEGDMQSKAVSNVAFSPDGSLMAVGAADGTVRLLETETWQETRCFKKCKALSSEPFSSCGRYLLIRGGEDSCPTYRVWDLSASHKELTVKALGVWQHRAVPSPDGRHLATGGFDDGAVRVWEFETGLSVNVLEGRSGYVADLCWSPDGDVIASVASELEASKKVRLWSWRDGGEQELEIEDAWNETLAYAPDGRYLAVGAKNGRVWVWDLLENRCQAVLDTGFNGGGMTLAFSSDGNAIASSGWHGPTRVKIWSAVDGHQLSSWETHCRVDCLVFSADGETLALGGDQARSRVELWSLANSEKLETIDGRGDAPTVIGKHEFLALYSDYEVRVTHRATDKTVAWYPVEYGLGYLRAPASGGAWAFDQHTINHLQMVVLEGVLRSVEQ